ncbi:MAG: class I SAM-dependent rRNA methyltransferase [Myxococcaceae bacterium]|nr:class I SAM-dependent rRNA methyltransferase [Myxococcaceae bacterium]MBH2006000.1 class I SAM-dependent rRNA methyltransferase [Myxococcaceae bacterium]
MQKIRVYLTRNLRRSILRGHPWVYRDAIQAPEQVERASLARVEDKSGFLAWGIYDPNSVLALRILSFESAPPSEFYFFERFKMAYRLRSPVRQSDTNGYRLINGEGDRFPGLVCDLYGDTAVLQLDGQGPSEFWNRAWIKHWITETTGCSRILEKKRREESVLEEPEVMIRENGVRFQVNLEKGQKTGFFFDQRENRQFIRSLALEKRVLNLFSYTGGFSVYAGLGGAKQVTSVDISEGAIRSAHQNWLLNGLEGDLHEACVEDVSEYLSQHRDLRDLVIVDPPSFAHSREQREGAKRKYVEIFAMAAQRVTPGGLLALSSCSSQIDFNDFHQINEEALAKARRRGQLIRVSGQGMDHPFPHVCPELRYLKFACFVLDG